MDLIMIAHDHKNVCTKFLKISFSELMKNLVRGLRRLSFSSRVGPTILLRPIFEWQRSVLVLVLLLYRRRVLLTREIDAPSFILRQNRAWYKRLTTGKGRRPSRSSATNVRHLESLRRAADRWIHTPIFLPPCSLRWDMSLTPRHGKVFGSAHWGYIVLLIAIDDTRPMIQYIRCF